MVSIQFCHEPTPALRAARATSATCCRAFALLILRVVPMLSLVLTASGSDAASVEVSEVLELGRFSPGYFALTPHLPLLWPRWPGETVGLRDVWSEIVERAAGENGEVKWNLAHEAYHHHSIVFSNMADSERGIRLRQSEYCGRKSGHLGLSGFPFPTMAGDQTDQCGLGWCIDGVVRLLPPDERLYLQAHVVELRGVEDVDARLACIEEVTITASSRTPRPPMSPHCRSEKSGSRVLGVRYKMTVVRGVGLTNLQSALRMTWAVNVARASPRFDRRTDCRAFFNVPSRATGAPHPYVTRSGWSQLPDDMDVLSWYSHLHARGLWLKVLVDDIELCSMTVKYRSDRWDSMYYDRSAGCDTRTLLSRGQKVEFVAAYNNTVPVKTAMAYIGAYLVTDPPRDDARPYNVSAFDRVRLKMDELAASTAPLSDDEKQLKSRFGPAVLSLTPARAWRPTGTAHGAAVHDSATALMVHHSATALMGARNPK